MKRFILVLLLVLSASGLFAQEYNVTFEKRYSNCTLQFIEDDNDGMFTIILMEIEYQAIPTMYIISSYNEKLIKNFLFFLVDNSPTKYPNKYDLSIIKKYENEHKELVLLDEKTIIKSNNMLQKRYNYKLELEE